MSRIRRVGIIGLGSMGTRRARCLARLGGFEVVGFDPVEARRERLARETGLRPAASLGAFWDARPEAVMISTPPDRHMPFALESLRRGIPFFTEASCRDDYAALLPSLRKRPRVVAAPSCCYRFHPLIARMKAWYDAHPRSRRAILHHHCGQWLPDWHPWEDYRTHYGVRKKASAVREMIAFDLVWLAWIFGPIRDAGGWTGSVSDLEIEGYDAVLAQLRFASGAVGTMQVDVVARTRERRLHVTAQDHTLDWTLIPEEVRLLPAGAKRPRVWTPRLPRSARGPGEMTAREWTYVVETKAFVDAAAGRRRWPYSFQDDREILSAVTAVEESHRAGRRVALRA